MSGESELNVEYRDSVPIARLSGEIDVVHAARLRERLLSSVRNEDAALILDLSEVRYIDSSGVNVMFELAERLAEGQIRFGVVVPPGGLVERVLEIVDIGSVASVHRSVADGVESLGG